MANRQAACDGTLGVSLLASTLIHLAVFLMLIWSGGMFPKSMSSQGTYYVDVVNLPVASPRAGSPTQKGNDAEAPAPPVPKKVLTLPTPPKPAVRARQQPLQKPAEKVLTLPTQPKLADRSRQQPPQKPEEKRKILPAPSKPETRPRQQSSQKPEEQVKSAEESDAFAERMAKLQGKAEAQEEEAALERLRHKVANAGSGRSGMPGGSGSEAGSRYEDYIKSRLEDALKKTSSYTTKTPVVVVQLAIAINGQISRKRIERSSGDHTFELAVMRAIEMVGEKLNPPPNHKVFESSFVFKPQEIANTKS